MKTVILMLALSLCAHCTAVDQYDVLEKRTDDMSLNSLKVIVQQQSTQIQALQASLEAQQNRITGVDNENAALRTDVSSLKNKVAVLSIAVAFTVRFRQDDGTHGISIGTHSPLRFDDVDFNAGNGYDLQTGIFSAPLAGTYAFFLTQMGTNSQGTVDLAIVKHGAILDVVYSKDHEDQGSSQVTTHLGAGEQVWVRHENGISVRGSWYTVFTGYLLKAD